MIRLHGDTNAISLNERPAVWPPIVLHITIHYPPPFLSSLISSSLSPIPFPSTAVICSIMFIDLILMDLQ